MQRLVSVALALMLFGCSGDSGGKDPNGAPNNAANNENNQNNISDVGGDNDTGGDAGSNDAGHQPNNDPDPADMGTPGDDQGAPDDMSAPDDMGTPGDDMAPPADMGMALVPTIPQPNGACPTFEDGEQDIMGLATDMLVGAPGATKGPLLFIWHGTGSNGNVSLNFQLPQSVKDDIVAQGGIIIAPNDNLQARTGFSPNGVWYEESDLEYADHIVACAVQDHNIDPRRIYVTGCSAGGLMAAGMALRRSNYVAAVSPNSGGLTLNNNPALQNPDWAPPTLCMHGGVTDTIGITNFGTTSARFNDRVTGEGGFAVDCDHLSGHCTAPNEVRVASWEFLKAHTYGAASPYLGGLPAEFPDYCEIW